MAPVVDHLVALCAHAFGDLRRTHEMFHGHPPPLTLRNGPEAEDLVQGLDSVVRFYRQSAVTSAAEIAGAERA